MIFKKLAAVALLKQFKQMKGMMEEVKMGKGMFGKLKAMRGLKKQMAGQSMDEIVKEFRARIEEFPLPGHNPKYPGLQISIYNTYRDANTPAGKTMILPTSPFSSRTISPSINPS